ncbi:hypothetical protein [Lentzea nigeriaca]|uniref:hypothetical protein n=1 Tax=Lentzea nigeriaca TaxID=1128665 RepID=UPI001957B8CD|nr:hypothetical protein [Lentzea nigeriaca]MBM7858808.1 hypothetical protein [Lentzea nigeriaca]
MRLFSTITALGVVLASGIAMTPASSADVGVFGRVYLGENYASSNGTWVEVCDMERDGNGVYGQFETNTGTSRVNDGNGSAGGCGNATFGRVNRFRVCEDRSGRPDPCSSWARP